ncbi:type II toxin-antitoxin system PemK/MazF family toxin [Deltaproteobacteria bacterium TL4]
MVSLAVGDVVLVRFPFSDLSQTKLRPAIVLAEAGKDDWILCQVTSNPYGDKKSIELTAPSFASGSLQVISYARPDKLFTANHSLIVSKVGHLTGDAFKQVIEAIVQILRKGLAN